MTSEERRVARRMRREAEREQKKQAINAEYGSYEDVFSFANLYKSYKKSCKGVLWKSSVQTYKANALANVHKARQELLSGKYKSKGFIEFKLTERGKLRNIRSVHISERVIQRCLCDYCLVPLLSRTFIHDSGASLKGKGIDFSLNRLKGHMREHYRKHGKEGWVLLFDFSKFFDNAQHKHVFEQFEHAITDKRLLEQAKYFIRQFGTQSLGLGSQISQISALALPNKLDHYIKDYLMVELFGRYMDDGYIISFDKDFLEFCKDEIKRICDELGIVLNERKTQIVKLTRGFTYLKARFSYGENGKVIMRINPKSVHTMRRKLRIFRSWVADGRLTLRDIETSYQSWRGHAKRFNSYKKLASTDKYYSELYPKEEISICTRYPNPESLSA